MAVDCAYSLNQLYVVEGGPPPGGEDISEDAVLKATQWLITNCKEANGTLKVNFFNLSVVQFSTLAVACPELQGWAILDDFIAIPILGVQNCRELVKSKVPENFIGKNWSNIEKPKKELVNLEKMAIAIKEQFFLVHCICLLSHLKTSPQPLKSCKQSFRIL